ncbi:MAG: D-glycero-D-manno-heptose 1,7-bisphosphate phosphatase [Candidatus Azotimanducaceae bacterium]|jgi:D-glycero-D-manno-heptose 1,7-bisphosphate phosphatase
MQNNSDRLIVLDRDGVINVDSSDYIKSAEEWRPLPGSIDAIVRLCAMGFVIYVASNQAGLAKQKFSVDDLAGMHAKLNGLVESAGGVIAGIFFCPHHPDEGCECRKPKPGLLNQIRAAHPKPIESMVFVGDSSKDILAALAGDCLPVLVLTGNGRQTQRELIAEMPMMAIFDDLASFTDSQARSG